MDSEYVREPCPMRILDDAGGGFTLGCVGGGIFSSLKGFQNSPSGMQRRLKSSVALVRTSAPRIGGSFAIWAGTFASFECAILGMRGIHDPWNSIASGACTGAVLAARSGLGGMARNALIGGILLAFIEGVGIMGNRLFSPAFAPEPPPPIEHERQGNSQYNY